MTEDILTKVISSMRTTFHLPPGSPITRETTSADVNGWDSLSHSMLIMNIEEEFGLELPFDRVYELANVGELVDLVRTTLPSDTHSS